MLSGKHYHVYLRSMLDSDWAVLPASGLMVARTALLSSDIMVTLDGIFAGSHAACRCEALRMIAITIHGHA